MTRPEDTRFRRLALAALIPFLGTCAEPYVAVSVAVPNIPANALSVLAVLKLNGQPVGQEEFTQQLATGGLQLGFKFPTGTRGDFEIELLARSDKGCVLSRAVRSVKLEDDVLYPLTAELSSKL